MSRILIINSLLISISIPSIGQSIQDFGTATGTHSSATSPTFIPNPTVSGNTYVRVGTAGGDINKVSTSNPLGTTGVHIRASAPTSASVNKLSPVVNATAGKVVYTRYKVLSGDASGGATATSGTWHMFFGNGAMFSDTNAFSGAQSFAGLHFVFGLNENVLLHWTTASETNNAWFEVERSIDALNFETVLKQSGAGNSSLIRNYQDIDKSPFTGISYYRLKQVDFNGDFSYSEIVPVNFDLNKLALTSAFSGQENNLIVVFNRAVDEPQFKLFDLSGKLVAMHSDAFNGTQFTIPAEILQKGIYLLEITVGELRFISKVIN